MIVKIKISYKKFKKINLRTLYFLKNKVFYLDIANLVDIELFKSLDTFFNKYPNYEILKDKIAYRISRKKTAVKGKRIYFNKKLGLMLIRLQQH